MTDTDLAQLANDHWRRFYHDLVTSFDGDWRTFGGVDAFVTRQLPIAFANGLLVVESAAATDVVKAIKWVEAQAVPFRVRIDASLGAPLLAAPIDAGLEREWTLPGMVLMPLADAPPPPTGVTANRVSAANLDDFIDATVESGMPREIAVATFDLGATAGGDVDYFLGRLDGRPAATATVVRTADVAGIYSVSTVDWARHRGVATAVTWAAVDRAREWQCRAVVLQASDMGYGLYAKMGFKTVVEYAGYGPRGSDPHEAF